MLLLLLCLPLLLLPRLLLLLLLTLLQLLLLLLRQPQGLRLPLGRLLLLVHGVAISGATLNPKPYIPGFWDPEFRNPAYRTWTSHGAYRKLHKEISVF